jgi:protein O-mannosyl-transferase
MLQNPSSHINLGAILHLQEKFAQAEESYLKALDLEPGDEITLLNLKRLRNLARRPHNKSVVTD